MDKTKTMVILPLINFIICYFLVSKFIMISAYEAVGYAITATLFEILLFKKYIWKLNFVQKMTGIQNIQGTWKGKLVSNYDNKEHIIEKVIIKQSFNEYKVVLETQESKSFSEINQIKLNEFNRMELQYLYKNESPANLRKKNPMHFGVASLEYKNNKLVGIYWTDREIDDGKNTRGTMELIKNKEKGNYDLISINDLFDIF